MPNDMSLPAASSQLMQALLTAGTLSPSATANPTPVQLPSLAEIEGASTIVYQAMPATPQYSWPLLNEALGFETWVKHENHTPTGAFKVRGGLVYANRLRANHPDAQVMVSATRGNHGQSIAFAAARNKLSAIIVVPHGNSREKNAAMRALGATLIEHGEDFQAARGEAARIAKQTPGAVLVPPFHSDLVAGVASYWLELFRNAPALDVVFVPIGMGSGANACLAVRNAVSPNTLVIGVTSSHARAFALSYQSGIATEAAALTQLADGMACRGVDAQALCNAIAHLDGLVEVSDDEVAAAMRLMFSATHQAGEGAGVASLAGAMKLKGALQNRRIGVTLCGANVDSEVFAKVLGS
jgi:threonine dehydratase